MTSTSSRTLQYIGLFLILALLGGSYWYFVVHGATTRNKGVSDTGLVGHWTFDEGSGTVATDFSGNGKTGTINGSPTWISGKLGQALSFSSSQNVSSALVSSQRSDVSFAFWANIHASSASSGQLFFNGGGGADGYGFYAGATGCSTTKLCFLANGLYWVNTGIDISSVQDAWHHFVVTLILGDGVNTVWTLYIDGAAAYNSSPSGLPVVPTVATSIRGGNIDVDMDDVRFYNRTLSSTDVTNLYHLGAAKVNTGQNSSLTSGLVGNWSFNGTDTYGTTATDRGSGGNNGTLTNGPTKTDGQVGQALSFDGTDDYVTMGNASALSFERTDSFTLAAWVSASSTASQVILGKSPSLGTPGYFLAVNATGGKVRFSLRNATATNEVDVATTYSAPFLTSAWHHIVATYNGTSAASGVKIYVDGESQTLTTSVNNLSATTLNSIDFEVGARDGTNSPFSGKIDEARVYNRTLAASEIRSLYTLGGGTHVNTTISTPQGTGRLDSGLEGYWPLDDGTSGATPTTAADSSTNGATGTLTNGPTWSTTGQIKNDVVFDGSNDYINVGNGTPLQLSNGTASVWFVTGNAGASYRGLLVKQNAYGLYLKDNVLMLYDFGGATDRSTGVTYNDSAWHMATVTFQSGVTNGTKIYADGKLVLTTTMTVFNQSTAAVIGDGGVAASQNFAGHLDEARVYNRVLSGDEVTQLYALTAPTGTDTSLKGYWSFNGNDMSGTTAYDRSGAGNTGTLTNGVTKDVGKLGQGLNFAAASLQYVDLGSPTALQIGGEMTISAWIKIASTGSLYCIIANNDFGATVRPYEFEVNRTAGKLSFVHGAAVAGTSNTSLSTNTWYFVTVVRTGSTSNWTSTFYLNGVADGSGFTLTNPTLGTTPVAIGFQTQQNQRYFDGSIDEVRVYNRALSAAEVAALYNSGR